MRAVTGLLILVFSISHAHEGHDDNLHQPSVIEKGKLTGKDQVVYLDAGAAIQWNGLKLKRKISDLNQVIYQFNDEIKEQTEPATPTVITAAAKPDEKPAFVAPAPQPESVNDDDVNAARNAYIKSVHQELKRNHRYPKMAERNGISGEVKVEIKFDKDGNMLSSSVIESSGNAALDEGALATVKRSNFKQYMKQILIGHIDTITVPIVFSLASN